MSFKVLISHNLFKGLLVGLITAGVFSFGIYAFATPPTSKYAPGETLNPSCAPGDTNCTTLPALTYTGATAAVDLNSQNFTTTGTLTAGTLKIGSAMTFPTADGSAVSFYKPTALEH